MKINIKKLSDEIARMEGGEVKLGTPQIAEVLGCFGSYLRSKSTEEVLSILKCLIERGGKRSHRYSR